MRDPYQNMLNWFGSLLCKMRKRHVWGRPYLEGYSVNSVEQFSRRCKRCAEIRPVKRRIKKDTK